MKNRERKKEEEEKEFVGVRWKCKMKFFGDDENEI